MPDYLPAVTPANDLSPMQMMYGPPKNPGALPQGQFNNVMGHNIARWPMRNSEPRGFPTAPDFILALNKLMGAAPARVNENRLFDRGPDIQPIVPSDQAYAEAMAVLQAAKIPQGTPQVDQAAMMTKFLQNLNFPSQ